MLDNTDWVSGSATGWAGNRFIIIAVSGNIQIAVLQSPYALASRSLLDDKSGASRLLDVPLNGFSILHVKLWIFESFSHQKYRQNIRQIRLILT